MPRGPSACVALAVLAATFGPAHAATNQATGDVAGDPGLLQDSNVVQIDSTGSALALVKRAFLDDGTPVPDASVLPRGSLVHFVIYVSNDSPSAIHDLNVQDTLDAAFAFQTGSLRFDNSVDACAPAGCTPAEEAAVFTAVHGGTALTDAIDGDVASYSAGPRTVDAGTAAVANVQVNIAASKVWALLFTVQLV